MTSFFKIIAFSLIVVSACAHASTSPECSLIEALLLEYPMLKSQAEQADVEKRVKTLSPTVSGWQKTQADIFLSTPTPSERLRISKYVANKRGLGSDLVKKHLSEIEERLAGATLRPLGMQEAQIFSKWRDSDMEWARIYGDFILKRPPEEIGLVEVGGGLAGTYGLTDWGREYASEKSTATLKKWTTLEPPSQNESVSFVAAIFGAREVIEAWVVILSVLTALGAAQMNRGVFRAVLTASLCSVTTAVVLVVLITQFVASFKDFADVFFVSFGIASIMLFLLVSNVAFHPTYMGGWMSALRKIGARDIERTVFIVVLLAVARESLEMAVSMTTLSFVSGWPAVLKGLLTGLPIGLVLIFAGWFAYSGVLTVRRLLVASGGFMVLASSSFAALFVNSLQQKGLIVSHQFESNIPMPVTVFTGLSGNWETSAAFIIMGTLIMLPWAYVRIRNYRKTGQGSGWIAIIGAWASLAVMAGPGLKIASLSTPSSAPVKTWETVSSSFPIPPGAQLVHVFKKIIPSSAQLSSSTVFVSDPTEERLSQEIADFAKDKTIVITGESLQDEETLAKNLSSQKVIVVKPE